MGALLNSLGVVVLGGAHGTLALARSLGGQNVPIIYITHDSLLPSCSRFIGHTIRWLGPNSDQAVSFLIGVAQKHNLEGWLLVPGADQEVRLVSENFSALSAIYRIILPAWDSLRWVCDKNLLYQRAAKLSLSIPKIYEVASIEHALKIKPVFPIVLKPNMGGGSSRLAKAKVVRVDVRASFLSAYMEAYEQIGADNIVVQELIPGGGESQFSYAALWKLGKPVAEFTARRTRQYPVDFGYTSTFVEIVEEPEAIKASRALLSSIDYSGLVEIEFKRDYRDNFLKLLDVNPRPWSWFGLSKDAGIDLGVMLWDLANGRRTPSASARTGTAWMYLARDIVATATLAKRGRISVGAYFESLNAVHSWGTFASNDVLPALIDLPLTALRVLKRYFVKPS